MIAPKTDKNNAFKACIASPAVFDMLRHAIDFWVGDRLIGYCPD